MLNYFLKEKHYNNILNDFKDINVSSLETLSFLLYLKYKKENRPMIVVLENLLACNNLYNDLKKILDDEVILYCADEISKYSTLASSPEFALARIYALNKLASNEPILILTHPMALDRLIPSRLTFLSNILYFKKNEIYKISEVKEKLIELGYKSVFKVASPFEFSFRGSVIDVFSINYKKPIRLDFFDDILDRITFFDEDEQRSIEEIDNVKVIPASEFLVNNETKALESIYKFGKTQIRKANNNLKLEEKFKEDYENLVNKNYSEELYRYFPFYHTYATLADYASDSFIYVVNEDKVLKNEEFLLNEITEDEIKFFENGDSLGFTNLFSTYQDFKNKVNNIIKISLKFENETSDLSIYKVDSFDFNLDFLYKELMCKELEHYKVYLGLNSKIHYDVVKRFFDQKQIVYYEIDHFNEIKEGINLASFDLGLGLDFKDINLEIIGENEVFSKKIKTRISMFSRYKNAVSINSINELEIGDYLVHEHYGIGIYQGIETMLNNNVHRDYLKIAYKDNDVLYVPLEQYQLVRKYISKEGAKPKINKLGSKEWEKTKTKIQNKVNDIAEKLINLYSLRAKKEGFAFEKDDDLQVAFENDFPYELTQDQLKCVNEIKKDMESQFIMDRLLVGDVGFGKTEIALRAAFKAINSGKQVALLCPTTLLARQHYLTSLDRFRNFGVRIKLLSRLISGKEEKEVIDDLASGNIDFIIGTHRILSDDVKFHNLGLLIVDEEHKFGVIHKEKIKEYKTSIDVLTLTATPIPRTLQMALTGIRGFSTINTPIDNRMPVQTYVIKKDNLAIKEIIERELARGGQVYYLCNQIERLPEIALSIKSMVRNANIAIAHGKLNSEDVEDIMKRFIENEYNILLCTTIIENGIDIPNVNTILVDQADNFGMSQLYQIKGRVGRSDRLAYCYLMYSKNKELTDIAKKRLSAIKEFTSLGSGYKIAMRDLIARGAGDILGQEQSGFIESVGIDMFIDMLKQAIISKKEDPNKVNEIKVKKPIKRKILNIDAYIPENYYSNDFEKIELYKEIEKVKSFAELNALKEKVSDETGKLPESINLLLDKKEFDLYLELGIIESYDEYEKYILIRLSKEFNNFKGVGMSLFDKACKVSSSLTLRFNNNQIQVEAKKNGNFLSYILKYFKEVKIIYDANKK